MIYPYSRKQAIEDGVLVDLSEIDSIRQHWKYPFACTFAVWCIIQNALEKPGQDVPGICRDIATIAKLAIRGGRGTYLVPFRVNIGARSRELKLHIGPGDTLSPVLTLMLPNED